MGEHGVYWTELMEAGQVVVFGVVADPAGAWGVSVVRAGDEPAVRAMTSADPVIRRGQGFGYEVFEMPNAVAAGAT